ncbi:MAG TPA: MFS transporter [Gemmatales bacterium]|nr:MFS transporter [Gemmatales bacterium]HMP59109.1 MFS transporter [Gemmatales bacterium]
MSQPASLPRLAFDLRLRLSVLMFLEFAIWGAWFVVFFDYLKRLGYDGTQAGWIFGNMALGAIISPMLVGLVADRFIASERLMAGLHLVGAALLYWMSEIGGDSYEQFFAVSLIYALVFNPTLSLANSITFTHVPDGTRDFPGIRVWGTIGWIAVNFFVGSFLNAQTNQPLLAAAALSGVLGFFSLMLPHTPPTGKPGDLFPFIKALRLFKDPSFAVFFVISGVITVVLAFYYSNTATFLQDLETESVPAALKGYFVKTVEAPPAADGAAPAAPREVLNPNNTMLIGQVAEMIVLPFLPFFLIRWGIKWVLVVGMLCWGIRYALFAQLGPFPLILVGVALHGICFDFFFAAGFIHVDNTAPKDIRASGQALFAFLTYGVGMWIGSILSGVMNDRFKTPTGVDWQSFWLVPSVGVLAAVLLFAVLFRGGGRSPRSDP